MTYDYRLATEAGEFSCIRCGLPTHTTMPGVCAGYAVI